MQYKNNVRESKEGCSRVMVLDGRRHADQKTRIPQMARSKIIKGPEYWQTSRVAEMEHTAGEDQRQKVVAQRFKE